MEELPTLCVSVRVCAVTPCPHSLPLACTPATLTLQAFITPAPVGHRPVLTFPPAKYQTLSQLGSSSVPRHAPSSAPPADSRTQSCLPEPLTKNCPAPQLPLAKTGQREHQRPERYTPDRADTQELRARH
eukprot:2281801-Rhodomonas_salina.7